MNKQDGLKAAWALLPRKDQLLILCFLRFVEPMVRISIATYIYYQLRALDPDLPSSVIIERAAFLQTAFTLAQCVSSMVLVKLADSPRGGRKMVLAVGLVVSTFSCVAFGFITSYWQAVVLRIIEGLSNGSVATVRTMVSEVVKDKRLQPQAFLMLPIAFNIAVLVSPLVGGQLADLGSRFPSLFGHVPFLQKWPFAPPALLNGAVISIAFLAVFFFLEETLEPLKGRHDPGIAFSRKILSFFNRDAPRGSYDAVAGDEEEMASFIVHDEGSRSSDADGHTTDNRRSSSQDGREKTTKPAITKKAVLPTKQMFTRNYCLVLAAYVLQEGHISAYNTLWTSFLSDPVGDPTTRRLPFFFGGGAGMPPSSIAWSQSVFGVVGLPLQLFVFTRLQRRMGTMRMWRLFLCGFPAVYLVIPYIAALPSSVPPPGPKSGMLVWTVILVVQTLMVVSSTFVIPAQLVLTNGSSPHPSALGRTHATAFLASCLVRATSAASAGAAYGWGSSHNLSGFAWWLMGLVAVVACVESLFVREGNGHEIWLEGDEE